MSSLAIARMKTLFEIKKYYANQNSKEKNVVRSACRQTAEKLLIYSLPLDTKTELLVKSFIATVPPKISAVVYIGSTNTFS